MRTNEWLGTSVSCHQRPCVLCIKLCGLYRYLHYCIGLVSRSVRWGLYNGMIEFYADFGASDGGNTRPSSSVREAEPLRVFHGCTAYV